MGYGGRGYGYTEGGYGYGVSDFVGVADVLRGLGGDPYSGWAIRRLSSRYTGPTCRLRRSSDNAELDFYGQGSLGLVSTDAVRSFAGLNLLGLSEAFDNVGTWQTLTGGTGATPSRTANTANSPTGTATADRIVLQKSTNTSSDRSGIRQAVAVTNGTQYTLSFWVRSNTVDSYNVQFHFSGASVDVFAVTPTWTRVTYTGLATTTGNAFFGLEVRGPGSSDFADLLLWGAQLVIGSQAKEYQPTTTAGGNAFLVTLYDQTGQARNHTQSTTTLQLIVCESGVPVTEGGRLAAKYVAADARRMAVASSTAAYNFLHTTGGSVAVVSRANDTAARKAVLSNKTGTSSAGILVEYQNNETLTWYAGRRDVAGVATNGATVTLEPVVGEASTANQIAVGLIDPDNASSANRGRVWRNGTASAFVNTETATPFIENAQGNLTLGARSDGTLPFDGTVQEVLIWDTLISDAVRDAYEADAGRFYGITVA